MTQLILASLYLFLPVYAANMAPVVANRFGILKFAAAPIDGGRTLKGKPVFGANKTFRGFLVAVLAGIIVSYIQYYLWQKNNVLLGSDIFPYEKINFAIWGFLLSFGALLGDLIKSFIKRRFNIAPGEMWFPWDQLDMVIGALVFASIVFVFPLGATGVVLVLTPILALIVNYCSYKMGLKEKV